MKKNDFILLISVVLYSWFLYDQMPGIAYLIFSALLIALLLIQERSRIKDSHWYVVASASLISGLCVMLYGTWLAFAANVVALSLLSALSYSKKSLLLFAGLYAMFSYITSIGYMIVDLIERSNKREKRKGARFWIKFSIGAGIFVIVLVFFFLYQASNPLFKNLTEHINLDFITWPWVKFTAIGFFIMYGFFYQRNFPKLFDKDIKLPNNLNKDELEIKGNRLFGKKLNIGLERNSGIILLALLNVLLLLVNTLDVIYLWIARQLPEDMTYAESLHQGTGMLVASIVLAILIILFYFRGSLNFSDQKSSLKWLANVWILQNMMMVVSTAYRNMLYINDYSLTYKRLGIYIWLLLTIIGLVLTVYKILRRKTNWYLFRANGWAFFGVLILLACFNWDLFITKYNIQKSKHLDKYYLVELKSPSNIPELLRLPVNEDDYKPDASPDEYYEDMISSRVYYDKYVKRGNFTARLHKRMYDFLNQWNEQGWQSWNVATSNAANDILKLAEEGKIEKILLYDAKLETLKPLERLKNIKYLNAGKNNITDLSGIEIWQELNYLDVSSNKLFSIHGIEGLTSLKELNLSNNNIGSMSLLRQLVLLETLNISTNGEPVNAGQLFTLKKLRELDLSNNEIKNLDSLKYLTELKVLKVNGLKNTDVNNLPVLPGMETLELGNNDFKINDIVLIEKFAAYKNLKKIRLSSNNIKTLYVLTDSRQSVLDAFFFGRSRDYVKGIFPYLEDLDVSSNKIKELSPLALYPDLKRLDISYNEISDFSQLETLKKLESLNLAGTGINIGESMPDLKNLKELNISNNSMSDMKGLVKLEMLESLQAEYCQIQNIKELVKMKHLKRLKLSNNLISDIGVLSKMRSLEELDIRNNSINNYIPLFQLKQLKILYVSEITLDEYNQLKEHLPDTRIVASYIYTKKNKRNF